jgi:flagellar biosynthesis/type III secretory pathway M-ring protein FliF/YscJ
MDPIYGLPLIAVLALAWLAARHVINKARRQRELLRRQRQRSRGRRHGASETVTSRSDMRSTDAPVTIVENIRKRSRAPKDGGDDKPPPRRG